MGDVIQAAALFQREPAPVERTKFWDWGKEYVDGPILNLQAIVDDMTNAENEEAFRVACKELVAEVGNFPDFDT